MTQAPLPPRDQFSWLYLSLAMAWSVVLWWLLLSEPGDVKLFRTPDLVLNLGHALIFAPLGALLYLGFPKCHASVLWAFVLSGVYGALMELLQTWVPGRIGDPIDAMTNVFGAAWGISCVIALGHWRDNANARLLRLPFVLLVASVGSALLATYA